MNVWKRIALITVVPVLGSALAEAQVPHVFQPGQIISADHMNENFAALTQQGAKLESIAVDCSSGPNAITQALSESAARELEITISGTCIEDHLKTAPHTSVTILGDETSSIEADVLEVNFSSLVLETSARAGTIYVARGLLFSQKPFRTKEKGAAAQAFLDGSPARGPLFRMIALGNGYIDLSDYGCTGNSDDQGRILSYNHSRVVLNLKESCGSSVLSAGTLSKISIDRAAGALLSSAGETIIRGDIDGSSIYLGSAEFSQSTDESGKTSSTPTGVLAETVNLVIRNMNINLQNVCLTQQHSNFLTTVVGHIEPASSCTNTFGSKLILNNGSHITSNSVLVGEDAPQVSSGSSYGASTNASGYANFFCDGCNL